MHGLLLAFALAVSNSAPQAAPPGSLPAPISGSKPSAIASSRMWGEPSLVACANAMAGIAWNSCDTDAEGYVYEDGKYRPPVYHLSRGAQRKDVPAGFRYVVIFCRPGQHPVDPATGAFLQKPGPRLRCASEAKTK